MVNRVDLVVNQVNSNELSRLTEEIDTLRFNGYQEEIANSQVSDEFVVTLRAASLPDIKDTLWAMLKIVDPERIDIET